MKRVLLTGATGYLGSHLLRRLIGHSTDFHVTILKRSYSNTQRIDELLPDIHWFNLDEVPLHEAFAQGTYDVVLHCATDYGRQASRRASLIETNLLFPLRLLELCVDHGVTTFVNTDTVHDRNVSDYARSKRQFFEWMTLFSGVISTINVALEQFYGPGDDPEKFTTATIRSILTNKPVVRLTAGEQRRRFIFVDDVVDAFVTILRHHANAPPHFAEYQVGGNESIRVRDFVMLLAELCGDSKTSLEFGALPYRDHEPMNVQVDLSALKQLGWKPRHSLRDGLTHTIRQEVAALQ